MQWSNPQRFRYFTIPEPVNPAGFNKTLERAHSKGMKVVPYTNLKSIPLTLPEYQFYKGDWGLGLETPPAAGPPDSAAFDIGEGGVAQVPSAIDFMLWIQQQLIRKYKYDGLYVDDSYSVLRSERPDLGLGYVRNGVVRQTFPVFADRELFKRAYSMLKGENPNNILVYHIGGRLIMPVVGFCDIAVNGEGIGGLKDDYLDIWGLDVFRAEFMGHQYGFIPAFLPELHWTQVSAEEKASPGFWTAFTQQVHGLALLHDFSIVYGNGSDPREDRRFYRILDEFGLKSDAKFFPYWNNSALIKGQTETIRASAYRKPNGGSLIVVFNTSRQPQTANLEVDWDRLKGTAVVSVVDAFTKEQAPVQGRTVIIEVKPLNYHLLWVK